LDLILLSIISKDWTSRSTVWKYKKIKEKNTHIDQRNNIVSEKYSIVEEADINVEFSAMEGSGINETDSFLMENNQKNKNNFVGT